MHPLHGREFEPVAIKPTMGVERAWDDPATPQRERKQMARRRDLTAHLVAGWSASSA